MVARLTYRAGVAADLPTRLRLLAHPVTTGALALLVVNDRILKAWAGGLTGPLDGPADLVTGKLSDVAGVLLVAVLVGVATARRRVSLVGVVLEWRLAAHASDPIAAFHETFVMLGLLNALAILAAVLMNRAGSDD